MLSINFTRGWNLLVFHAEICIGFLIALESSFFLTKISHRYYGVFYSSTTICRKIATDRLSISFTREWNLLVFRAAVCIGFLIALESTFSLKKITHGFCGVFILPQPCFSDSNIWWPVNACFNEICHLCVWSTWYFNGLTSSFLDQETGGLIVRRNCTSNFGGF